MLRRYLENMLLTEIIIIISYLLNGYCGFTAFIIFMVIILRKKNLNIYEKICDIAIASMPLHSISIIGTKINHAVSWPLIVLSIIIIYGTYTIIKEKKYISKDNLILILICLLLLIISNINNNDITGMIKVIQVLLMALPIITTYKCKDIYEKKLRTKYTNTIEEKIKNVILATAIGTITQFLIYQISGIRVGEITLFNKRHIFDLFFNAYSVLSVFLGIGLVIKIKQFTKKIDLIGIIEFIIIFASILINSSRTGLIAAIITFFIISNTLLKNKKRVLFNITILLIIVITIILMTCTRKDLPSFINSNSRFDTYKYGLELLSDKKNLLIGNGLDLKKYDKIVPHNFILETMVSCGIIFTTIIIYKFIKLLMFLKDTSYKYIIYHILIASMFITCFQGNPFTTIIIIIAIIDQEKRGSVNENINSSTNLQG